MLFTLGSQNRINPQYPGGTGPNHTDKWKFNPPKERSFQRNITENSHRPRQLRAGEGGHCATSIKLHRSPRITYLLFNNILLRTGETLSEGQELREGAIVVHPYLESLEFLLGSHSTNATLYQNDTFANLEVVLLRTVPSKIHQHKIFYNSCLINSPILKYANFVLPLRSPMYSFFVRKNFKLPPTPDFQRTLLNSQQDVLYSIKLLE